MNRFAISIPDEYVKELDRAAREESLSRSEMIRVAIKDLIDSRKRERETEARREAAWRDMDEIRAKTKGSGFNSTEFLHEWRYRDAK